MVDQQKKEKTILNLANALSFLRMALAPVFMLLVFSSRYTAAFIVILIATLTDFLDGQVARLWKMQTRLGRMIDPLADKIIIFFAVITLLIKSNFPLWLAIIIFARDIVLLTGGIIFLKKYRQKTLVPNFLGKLTMFIQMSTIVVYILDIRPVLTRIFLFLTAFFTVISAAVYFQKGYRLFFREKGRKARINLPNKITLLRITLIPIFIIFLMSNIRFKSFVAAFIFIILALSDAFDGYLARKRRQITSFGILIDPLADKLLVTAALIFLIGKGIEPWMAYTIIAREFAITGLRMIAVTKNYILPARISGKIKTVVQVVAIVAVLTGFSYSRYIMLTAVAITIYSGIEYLWAGRALFKELI